MTRPLINESVSHVTGECMSALLLALICFALRSIKSNPRFPLWFLYRQVLHG